MRFFVDMQGFNSGREFIIKELGIVSEKENSRPLHYLFEPPSKFEELSSKTRAGNHWVTRNMHHLPWSVGDMPYNKLEETLSSALKNCVAFVKGSEKRQFLNDRVTCTVFDLSECEECPSLSKLRSSDVPYIRCPLNHDSMYCAYQTCQILKYWYCSQIWNIEDYL